MGIASEIRITMMVITTIISTKVKPRRRFSLPFCIGCSIGCLVAGLGIDVEDALAAPARGVRFVLIAAHSPLALTGERIHRNPPQEAHLLAVGAWKLHPIHQHV